MNPVPEIRNILAPCVKRLLQINSRCCVVHRAVSSQTSNSDNDPLPVYLNEKVQSILTQITTIDLAKLARLRMAPITNTPQFKLMGKKELQELENKMLRNVYHQVINNRPPVMKARAHREYVLQEDPELALIMDANYVFVDISKGYNENDQDRWMVVRDREGTLRTASHEEHERLSQLFYPQEGRSINAPSMFIGVDLEHLLNEKKHNYILERACVQFEPDDPKYIEVPNTFQDTLGKIEQFRLLSSMERIKEALQLTSNVYDHINKTQQFDLLRSTRHFGPMAFYLAWNDEIDLLLADMLQRNLLLDAEDLVKLYYIVKGLPTPEVQKLDLIKEYFSNYSDRRTKARLELSVQSYVDLNKDSEPAINIQNRQLLQKVIQAGGL